VSVEEPSIQMRRRLAAWGVTPSGPGLRTPSSELMPGTFQGRPVMLKIALVEEEARGAALLQWWGGRGAARVLVRDERATLMERATGTRELAALAASGQDATATDILVRATLALHDHPAPTSRDGVRLVSLHDWFRDLLATDSDDPLLRRAADLADRLLFGTTTQDIVVLHGDIHHGNVLDFGDRWAVIDPKALLGHRAFDFANILCNPDRATAVGNLDARIEAISRRTGISPRVLADWAIAWCGLSLAWERDDGPASWHSLTTRAVAESLIAR